MQGSYAQGPLQHVKCAAYARALTIAWMQLLVTATCCSACLWPRMSLVHLLPSHIPTLLAPLLPLLLRWRLLLLWCQRCFAGACKALLLRWCPSCRCCPTVGRHLLYAQLRLLLVKQALELRHA